MMAAASPFAAWWQRLPADWRSERALMAAGLVLSAIFLVAFCLVVGSVVRSAERQHQAENAIAHPQVQVVSATP